MNAPAKKQLLPVWAQVLIFVVIIGAIGYQKYFAGPQEVASAPAEKPPTKVEVERERQPKKEPPANAAEKESPPAEPTPTHSNSAKEKPAANQPPPTVKVVPPPTTTKVVPPPTRPTPPSTTTQQKTPPANNRPAGIVVENETARNVVIRDQDGDIVYRGDVVLSKTLDRIEADEQIERFANDGSVFGNFERRLPRKDRGYYREWVHPTPGLNGPGPQRIVTGKDGDIWYTPDHYEHFYSVSP